LCSGGKKKTFPTKPQTTFELDSPLKLGKSWQEQYSRISAQPKNLHVANMMEVADERIAGLNREINILKEEKMQQSEIIATFKNQVFLCFCTHMCAYLSVFCMCLTVMH
jgi:hypothetical protein